MSTLTYEGFVRDMHRIKGRIGKASFGEIEIVVSPLIADKRETVGHHIKLAHPLAFWLIRALRVTGLNISPWTAFPMVRWKRNYYRMGSRIICSPAGYDALKRQFP